MPSQAPRKRPGPTPKPDRGAPIGYRVTARRRFELVVAQGFTGTHNLQGVVDVAVEALLADLRTRPGFENALKDAEQEQRRRANVAIIGPPTGDDGS